ncbi:MAG: hypothetical protein M1820_010408 [Bogoriella megaspora]|nr:MAG: hypothetical protein M1820_010408 [Bogoriella megaspora]
MTSPINIDDLFGEEYLIPAFALRWNGRTVDTLCPYCLEIHQRPYELEKSSEDSTSWPLRGSRGQCDFPYGGATTVLSLEYEILFPFDDDDRVHGLAYEVQQYVKDGDGTVNDVRFRTIGLDKDETTRMYQAYLGPKQWSQKARSLEIDELSNILGTLTVVDKSSDSASEIISDAQVYSPPLMSSSELSSLRDATYRKTRMSDSFMFGIITHKIFIGLKNEYKTVAMLNRDAPFPLVAAVSGWTPHTDEGQQCARNGMQRLDAAIYKAKALDLAQAIGFQFSFSWRDSDEAPGSYQASHAEAQLIAFLIDKHYLVPGYPRDRYENEDMRYLVSVQPPKLAAQILVAHLDGACNECRSFANAVAKAVAKHSSVALNIRFVKLRLGDLDAATTPPFVQIATRVEVAFEDCDIKA